MSTITTRDRVAGVLLGLAVGDLHGGPIRMAVRLAESLADRGTFDANDVLARYLLWYREGAFDTGPVAEGVLARVASGEAVGAAVRAVHEERGGMTAGCNAAHRCPPLAMARHLAEESVAEGASREAALTHFDPLAGDVAAGVAVLCRRLLNGLVWTEALAGAATGRQEPTRQALGVVGPGSLNRGGYAPDVLAAAVHFLDHYDNFTSALEASFVFAAHWNYCPVLVGAIGGARWGAGSVPTGPVRHTDLLPRVRAVAERLAAEW